METVDGTDRDDLVEGVKYRSSMFASDTLGNFLDERFVEDELRFFLEEEEATEEDAEVRVDLSHWLYLPSFSLCSRTA